MKHVNPRGIVRPFIALALMLIVALVATAAAAPPASAHALPTSNAASTSGQFVPVGPNEYANLVVNGVTIGYVETLTDGHGHYEQHGHASVNRQFGLLLENGDNYATSSYSGTTQDVYLFLQYGGSPTVGFLEIQFTDTGTYFNPAALYYATFGF